MSTPFQPLVEGEARGLMHHQGPSTELAADRNIQTDRHSTQKEIIPIRSTSTSKHEILHVYRLTVEFTLFVTELSQQDIYNRLIVFAA